MEGDLPHFRLANLTFAFAQKNCMETLDKAPGSM